MANVPRSIRLTSGKGDFIKRVVPGTGRAIDICLNEWNVDLTNGCIAQVNASHLDEVVQNNGLYLPGNFDIYRRQGTADKRCDYCYAWNKNSGSVIPFVVDEKTRADFEEHKPKFLRFGKNTEPGHPYYFEAFSKLIDLCIEYRTIPMMPTKMLPFGIEGAEETIKYAENGSDSFFKLAQDKRIPNGKDIAQKLKAANTSLMMSLGYDELEPGPKSQGCSNEWRIQQAVNYYKSGVNASLTVVCDVTDSIKNNVSRHSFIGRALEERTKTGIPVRIIPARSYTHKVTEFITGAKKSVLTDTGYHITPQLGGLDDGKSISPARYVAKGAFKLVPNYIHPDFKGLFIEGMGACGVAAETEHCDKCNCMGKTRISFPESELPKIEFTTPTRRKLFMARARQRKFKNIPLLPDFKMPKANK